MNLAELARRWESYPRLLVGLCERAGVPVTVGPGGRRPRQIDRQDVPRLRTFFASWRSFKGASRGKGHRWHPIA